MTGSTERHLDGFVNDRDAEGLDFTATGFGSLDLGRTIRLGRNLNWRRLHIVNFQYLFRRVVPRHIPTHTFAVLLTPNVFASRVLHW
jgi:hypothetical protein